jgi:hypothetical protein
MVRRKDTSHLALNCFCLLASGLGLGWLVGLSASPVIQTILASLVAIVVSVTSALAGLHPSDAETDAEHEDPPKEGEDARRKKVKKKLPAMLNPLPVMFMVIGLAGGASVGVYARANDWLGARTNSLVEEWKDTGLSAKEITTRVFDSLYPPPMPTGVETQEPAVAAPSPSPNANANQTTSTAGAPKQAQEREKTAAAVSKPAVRSAPPVRERSNIERGILFTASLDECQRLRNAEGYEELRREMASTNDNGLVSLARTCKSLECLQAGVNKACAKYK